MSRAAQVPLRRPAGARQLVRLTDAWREICCGGAPTRAGAYPAAGARAARRDGGGRRADAGQHQVQRRADPADLRRRPGQAGGGRGAARPELPRHRQGGRARCRPTRSCEAMVNVHGHGRCAITLDPKEHAARPAALPGRGAAARRPGRAAAAGWRGAASTTCCSPSSSTPAGAGGRRRGGRRPADPALAGRGRGQPGSGVRRNEDEIGRNEDFNRIAILAATLTREELLTLDAETMLRRLFWEETLLRFEPQQPQLRLHLLARARAQHAPRPGPRRESTASSPSAARSRSAASSAASSTASTRSMSARCSRRRATSRRARQRCSDTGHRATAAARSGRGSRRA